MDGVNSSFLLLAWRRPTRRTRLAADLKPKPSHFLGQLQVEKNNKKGVKGEREFLLTCLEATVVALGRKVLM